MKRCPECHFTFDDCMSVCDFDGSELAPFIDSAPLSDRIVVTPRRPRITKYRSGLAVLAGLLLASGIYLAVRDRSSSPERLTEQPGVVERRQQIVAIAPARKPKRRIAYAHKHDSGRRVAFARTSSLRRTSVAAHRPARGFGNQTVALSEKKDSKVTVVFKKSGSFLKKALSILRKPFEL